ncbi:RNA ligase RtcB family protein [Pendulispora albinea]|uniref:3'-phosphate/5'-hydroxy nucleic acid ligase n=1 Tax=Pendulispora albinea TaxID=2741071 RepID=A0ABZ2LWW7_9BACT
MIRIDERTRIVASPSSWIEGEAERQLRATAALDGVRWAVGMPDLHPGKGHPIGVAVLTDGVVYPHLVGGDIGCGMALFRIELASSKVHGERLAKRLRGLEGPWEGDSADWLRASGVESTSFSGSLGTIGGGNHFAELQAVHAMVDGARVESLGVRESTFVLLVHSGSRGLGESILRAHVERHGAKGLEAEGEDGRRYLHAHDDAVAWGRANRALIAHRFAASIGAELHPLFDVCHNAVLPHDGGWLHRKGAAPHDVGPVVIPGSRGALTYLVEPLGDGLLCGHSLAHGAGRKWTRSDARERIRERFRADDLRRTALGSIVVCDDKDLLFEEAPEAYKRIDRVVGDLTDDHVCRILATFRPLVTYKTRHTTR